MDYQLKKILLKVSTFYRADLRAVALLRIGIALVIIADLLIRGADLAAHYTDKGLWPTALIHTFGWQKGFWSLHTMSGSYSWALILFSLHFVAACFLLLGYKTRLTTIILWLLTISLHNRNLFVLQSGDDLLRLILLWGCFLPWHYCYSWDAKRKSRSPQRFTFAYPGYLILLASVYFFSALFKSGPEWHSEGSAIYYALSLEQLRLPFLGDWLYQFPGLMKFLTHVVFYSEFMIPFLVLWPSKKGYLRMLAFLLILCIHVGIGSTLHIGLFFIISIVASLGLLPAFVMDKFESIFRIAKHNEAEHHEAEQSSLRDESSLHCIKKAQLKKNQPFLQTLQHSVCLIIIALCMIINLSGVKWFRYELDNASLYPANVLRLNQYWGMFSPYVMKKDGWFVYYGGDSIGRQWDLRRNEDYVDFVKPKHIVNLYSSDRWRKLAENMQDDRFTFLRPLYCKYVLQTWNENHPEKKIAMLTLYYMEKHSLADYKTSPVEKKIFSVCVP